MSEPHDRLPQLIATLDQFVAEFGLIAKAHKSMCDEYVEAGFTDEQAMQMTIAYFGLLMNGGDDE